MNTLFEDLVLGYLKNIDLSLKKLVELNEASFEQSMPRTLDEQQPEQIVVDSSTGSCPRCQSVKVELDKFEIKTDVIAVAIKDIYHCSNCDLKWMNEEHVANTN